MCVKGLVGGTRGMRCGHDLLISYRTARGARGAPHVVDAITITETIIIVTQFLILSLTPVRHNFAS